MTKDMGGCRGHELSVPITTNIVSSNPVHG